jgi:hypothetical protein
VSLCQPCNGIILVANVRSFLEFSLYIISMGVVEWKITIRGGGVVGV